MYKFNVEIKLDTEEKLESDFIEGLTELLNDEIGDVCKVSVKEDTKWQKLKEWINENKYKQLDDRNIGMLVEGYIEELVDVVNVKSLLEKMQELEAEDVE